MQLMLFDYQQLDTETRSIVQQRTNEIKALMKRTAQDIVDIGRKLIEVKERLPHGTFGGYLESEFEWKTTTAWKFMQAATKFSQCEDLSNFAPSALYLLAAPSTPDEARQEAVERAEQGENITHSKAKEIVEDHQTPITEDDESETIINNFMVFQDEAEPENGNGHDPEPETSFDYKRDTKTNRKGDAYVPQGYDACQTPPTALDPLLPYIPTDIKIIWEPACGEGYLVEGLYDSSFDVIPSDILEGNNFFDWQPDNEWDCLITNPPYSIKYKWLERCYELGKPFALLMPVEMLGAIKAQELFFQYGIEVVFPRGRINFKMPNKGWEGGGAQFPTAWFTWGFDIGQGMTFTIQ